MSLWWPFLHFCSSHHNNAPTGVMVQPRECWKLSSDARNPQESCLEWSMQLLPERSDRDKKPPEALGTANLAAVNKRNPVSNKTEDEQE